MPQDVGHSMETGGSCHTTLRASPTTSGIITSLTLQLRQRTQADDPGLRISCHRTPGTHWRPGAPATRHSVPHPPRVASQPVDSHVHGFGTSWLYVVVHDSEGCGVVGLHGSLGLFVAHFCKCYLLWNCFSCIDVEGSRGNLPATCITEMRLVVSNKQEYITTKEAVIIFSID